ncbi:hypothetical protein Tco_0478034 [Tanacetum coccineum]
MHIRTYRPFFLTNKTGAPQVGELGLIKPLSVVLQLLGQFFHFQKETIVRCCAQVQHQASINGIPLVEDGGKTGDILLGITSGNIERLVTSSRTLLSRICVQTSPVSLSASVTMDN